MITKELRSYDSKKIRTMVVQLKTSNMENRFRLAQGELTNTSQFRKNRRVIAQLLTILRERGERLEPKDWKDFGKDEDGKQ